ncbi:hypothetical protein KY290_008908 [Solanum tuberosum]|uniref:Uncharacterized protein n=1 Tax=Solanum tuberosum TaxID=4113 RepID=A0ABQ7WCF7_SOLTU|nr:hypothetical protein KY289_008791 [Solanum tuberosum]KAH0715977.1 hypothetical protein KY284_008882 [Solanum tuberosum]KAH0747195.1 hypothetical protein KY285_008852 [Solanum tuberosum]KAH0777497.1 hypothetical protein KY290_008908 [Solanum tuberosum]
MPLELCQNLAKLTNYVILEELIFIIKGWHVTTSKILCLRLKKDQTLISLQLQLKLKMEMVIFL